MLKVGRLADYGVLLLHHLGRVRPARLSMETLSELTHVPLPTVRKVMRFLIEAERCWMGKARVRPNRWPRAFSMPPTRGPTC